MIVDMNTRVRAYLKKHPAATTSEVVEGTDATPQRVGKVRAAMIAAGEIAADAEVVEGEPSTALVKRSAKDARIAELEEESLAYQARVVELLEHVAELSAENLRLSRLARANAEG